MAGLAGAYLAYCDCVRKGTGEKMSIVAIFSQGDDDNLMVGPQRHFLRPQGARLRRHHHQDRLQPDQPAPGVLGALQETGPHDRGANRQTRRRRRRRATRQARKQPPPTAAQCRQAKPAEPKKIDVGTVAALGVAVGAIGSAVAVAPRLVQRHRPLAIARCVHRPHAVDLRCRR